MPTVKKNEFEEGKTTIALYEYHFDYLKAWKKQGVMMNTIMREALDKHMAAYQAPIPERTFNVKPKK